MDRPSIPVLRVGVTGHRLNKLDASDVTRLKREVAQALARLRTAADEFARAQLEPRARCKLHVVSPLAEGADRIVAEAALKQGAELIVLLPFPRDDYALDFGTPSSRADFAKLLEQAAEVRELDGRRESTRSRNAAYSRVGTLVVERSDMLIALWDGEKPDGTGGTAQVIEFARKSGKPILWLPAFDEGQGDRPETPRLLVASEVIDTDAMEAFAAIAKTVLGRQLAQA